MSGEEAMWNKIDELGKRQTAVELAVKLHENDIQRIERHMQNNHASLMTELHGMRSDMLSKITPVCEEVAGMVAESHREEGRKEERAKEQERKEKSLSRFKVITSISVSILGIFTAIMAWFGYTGG